MRRFLLLCICCIFICGCAYRWSGTGLEKAKTTIMEQLYIEVSEVMFPLIHFYDAKDKELVCKDIEQMMLPAMSRFCSVSTNKEVTPKNEDIGQDADNGLKPTNTEESTQEEIMQEETTQEETTEAVSGAIEKKVVINRSKLKDFDYLRQNFYQIDNTTTIDSAQLDVDKLLEKDMTLKDGVDGPQVLIYHTHSQEGYADSKPGDANTSVVAVGDYLTTLLTEQYGIEVLHHTGTYDVNDRARAYSNALPAIEQVLKDNPTIEVVIDLHRDGVAETTHLVTELDGKQTAKIMFFNGLSRTTSQGELDYLANPNLEDNLAFSFQMQLTAAEYYPGLTRKIYLKGYRYNMHLKPKSLLVEVGAQTNSFEEAKNAMEPLADILAKVLKGM